MTCTLGEVPPCLKISPHRKPSGFRRDTAAHAAARYDFRCPPSSLSQTTDCFFGPTTSELSLSRTGGRLPRAEWQRRDCTSPPRGEGRDPSASAPASTSATLDGVATGRPSVSAQQLRRLCTSGYDLGATASRSRDRVLYDAVLQHFGSWRKALTASGIKLANVSRRRPKHLDREVMTLWLQQRQPPCLRKKLVRAIAKRYL